MQICAERLAIGASSLVKDRQAAGKLLLASQLQKGLCAAGKVLQLYSRLYCCTVGCYTQAAKFDAWLEQ